MYCYGIFSALKRCVSVLVHLSSFFRILFRFNPNWFKWCNDSLLVATKIQDGGHFLSEFKLLAPFCENFALNFSFRHTQSTLYITGKSPNPVFDFSFSERLKKTRGSLIVSFLTSRLRARVMISCGKLGNHASDVLCHCLLDPILACENILYSTSYIHP